MPCRPTCAVAASDLVGSTIVYAFMQSVGLVDDHVPSCFRYRAEGS
ncbi:MAG: DNA-3-methyladenine glycosylase I [Candidatus Limnocylindrales bacterium]